MFQPRVFSKSHPDYTSVWRFYELYPMKSREKSSFFIISHRYSHELYPIVISVISVISHRYSMSSMRFNGLKSRLTHELWASDRNPRDPSGFSGRPWRNVSWRDSWGLPYGWWISPSELRGGMSSFFRGVAWNHQPFTHMYIYKYVDI